MEPLARLDSKSILSEEIFLEIFDQEDEIMKARMILSLTDRAGELGVKKKFEELLKDNVYADPQETAEIVKKNYGLAGKRYIEVLKGIGKEKLHQMQKEFMQELKDDEAMQKQSLSLSILLVADKVATDYLFRDGEYITIEQAKTVLINRNDLSDNERCYRYLQDKGCCLCCSRGLLQIQCAATVRNPVGEVGK